MNRRRALGLLLVALTLLVMVTSRVHRHGSVSDFCLLCHTTHLLAPAAVPTAALILPDFLCWNLLVAQASVPVEAVRLCRCSRAPPAASFDSSPFRAA
jgi:hypothetical protein